VLGYTFQKVNQYDVLPSGSYKVALVFSNDDYHWYRQNPDGTWSHKPGITQVTNLDASGNLIYNPKMADRDYSNDEEPN